MAGGGGGPAGVPAFEASRVARINVRANPRTGRTEGGRVQPARARSAAGRFRVTSMFVTVNTNWSMDLATTVAESRLRFAAASRRLFATVAHWVGSRETGRRCFVARDGSSDGPIGWRMEPNYALEFGKRQRRPHMHFTLTIDHARDLDHRAVTRRMHETLREASQRLGDPWQHSITLHATLVNTRRQNYVLKGLDPAVLAQRVRAGVPLAGDAPAPTVDVDRAVDRLQEDTFRRPGVPIGDRLRRLRL